MTFDILLNCMKYNILLITGYTSTNHQSHAIYRFQKLGVLRLPLHLVDSEGQALLDIMCGLLIPVFVDLFQCAFLYISKHDTIISMLNIARNISLLVTIHNDASETL